MKPTLYMMAGLPGSGKSTRAIEISEQTGAIIHASDKLREELFGDENDQTDNQKLFQELHRRIKADLLAGKDIVYDATNINSKKRKAFLDELKSIPCKKICIIVASPYENCLIQNGSRERVIPGEVIRRMYMNWNTPYWFEGWDDIRIYYPSKSYHCRNPIKYINAHMDYDQDNSHHNLSLGEHSEKTFSYIFNRNLDVALNVAAILHDCGKPFTKTYINTKDEITKDSHYFQHQCVGAYDSLFYSIFDEEIDWSILINLHMQPYFWEKDKEYGEKTRLKYKRLWGDELYNNVMLLHEADLAAH